MGRILTSPIRCVKANIKRDKNGELYLEYFGETKIDSGEEINVYIEKLNLNIDTIKYYNCKNADVYNGLVSNKCISVPLYIGKYSEIKIDYKVKEMTKEEIEKELGYKIKIV